MYICVFMYRYIDVHTYMKIYSCICFTLLAGSHVRGVRAPGPAFGAALLDLLLPPPPIRRWVEGFGLSVSGFGLRVDGRGLRVKGRRLTVEGRWLRVEG